MPPQSYANPWLHVKKNSRKARTRFMSKVELARYWQALHEIETEGRHWQMSFFALRYMLMTGRRKDETLSLRWDMLDLDSGDVTHERTKTGPKVFQLSGSVVEMLQGMTRLKGCDYVFASFGKANTPIDEHSLYGVHKAICERAEIVNLQVHDCGALLVHKCG